jgi:sulfur carrier protein
MTACGRWGQSYPRAMRIEVNGEAREVEAGSTVADLLVALGLGGGLVAVERNRDIVPRAQHAVATLFEGDKLEVVHFVGGG